MPLEYPFNTRNDTPNKLHVITANCDLLWSLAQQFSYLRLSDKQASGQYHLIGLYAARARRIAATYARFYLETEEGGDPSKKGRYYWMALAAFASKTVACLLDTFQIKGGYLVGRITPLKFNEIANSLGQGNLWLFSDIAPTHWFYSHYPHHFFSGMDCLNKRHANQLEPPVKQAVNDLPWAIKSLSKVEHFQVTPALVKGFRLVMQIERMAPSKDRADIQFDHLMAIAEHEQKEVLQPLIYDDPTFKALLQQERSCWRWAAPTYQIVFTHACSTDNPLLKSVAPDEMVLEDFESRMKWIEKAAGLFHKLMQKQTHHMKTELATIAGWVDSPDAHWVY